MRSSGATILFAWELGGGLGHLANIAPIASRLQSMGHKVVVAVADSAIAASRLGDIPFIPAPSKTGSDLRRIHRASSFAEILYNAGWAQQQSLYSLVRAWRHLIELVDPGLVVLDYSPTALMALHGLGIPCVQTGTGFYCPPVGSPLPDLCQQNASYPDRLALTEASVLKVANECLSLLNQPLLPCLSAIFRCPNEILLATYRELDHYPDRTYGEYFGVWSSSTGVLPNWPNGEGPRIFAYLRPSQNLGQILTALAAVRGRTLVFLPDADPQMERRYSRANLHISKDPLNMSQVVTECDCAVLYGSHATIAELLLAGKPIVVVPSHSEQLINARNVERLGAGLSVLSLEPASIQEAVNNIVKEMSYAEAARAFARKYADVNRECQLDRFINRLQGLLN